MQQIISIKACRVRRINSICYFNCYRAAALETSYKLHNDLRQVFVKTGEVILRIDKKKKKKGDNNKTDTSLQILLKPVLKFTRDYAKVFK